jgi:Cu(I)/Ag(I) efflux system membrane protein CusA/SilA
VKNIDIVTSVIGGIITSTIMELAVYPAIFFIWRSRKLESRPVLPTIEAVPA